MATLTETAYISRMTIKYGGIALAVLIVGRFSLGIAITAWNNAHPEPPPPPTFGFGELPPIEFPNVDTPQLTYRLETPTGKFPNFPDRTAVYFMPAERPNLLALDKANQDAASLGYKTSPEKRSDVLYRWKNSQPLPSTLDMFIYQGNFTLNVNWSSTPDFLATRDLPDEESAITQSKSFLNRANLLPEDLSNGEANITYLKAKGNALSKTISHSEADFIQVDLFRQALETFPIHTTNPEQGIVQVIVSGNPTLARIISVKYNYFPVDYMSAETYPLKSAAQAWEELLAGQGYIARIDPQVEAVVVRRIELGYYDTYEAQKFLQPIYIFRGDDNYIGYVSAVGNLQPSP